MRRALSIAVVLIGFATPTGADFGEDWQYCSNEANPDVAIEACTEVIQAGKLYNENLAIAYFNRGSAYYEKGDYRSAVQDFNEAIRLKPNYAEAYYSRGVAYHESGRNDLAEKDYTRANRLKTVPR